MTRMGRVPSFEQLGVAECWMLVGTHGVGRVGFMGDTHLRIVPTRYDAERGTAYIRATTFGELARGAHERPTSLQVDDLDRRAFTGWSVLMTGTAHRVQDPALVASLWSAEIPHPWSQGPETQWIALVVEAIEGQRVAA